MQFLHGCFIFGDKSKEDLNMSNNIRNALYTPTRFITDSRYDGLQLLDIHIKVQNSTVIIHVFYKKIYSHP